MCILLVCIVFLYYNTQCKKNIKFTSFNIKNNIFSDTLHIRIPCNFDQKTSDYFLSDGSTLYFLVGTNCL